MPDRTGTCPGWKIAQFYPYESVIEQWEFSQFFGFQTAVSTQEVERPESLLATAAAALTTVRWRLDDHNGEIQSVPQNGWEGGNGDAFRIMAGEAADILAKISEVVNMTMVACMAEYGKTIGMTRQAMNESTDHVVTNFEDKQPQRTNVVGQFFVRFLIDQVTDKVFGTIDAMKGMFGPLSKITGELAGQLWNRALDAVGANRAKDDGKERPDLSNVRWSELASDYMAGQADILDKAGEKIEDLTRRIKEARADLRTVPLPETPPR
jgi:hypothetical protein